MLHGWRGSTAACPEHMPPLDALCRCTPQSRQLSFGFEAERFLRTENISYAADKRAYDPFFR